MIAFAIKVVFGLCIAVVSAVGLFLIVYGAVSAIDWLEKRRRM